jgi:4-hydroxy-3-methylbut-2-enyl diphosphate reductase IspH
MQILEARFVNAINNVKEIHMKRTIAFLSLGLVLAVTAIAQTSQLKAVNAACGACCGDNCSQSCCPDGCGDCCNGK